MLENIKVGNKVVFIKKLQLNHDNRGYLYECWRLDEFDYEIRMSYVSFTRGGEKRGPHEHEFQTDMFIFPGPGLFDIYLWDAGLGADSRKILHYGADNPHLLIVPPGIVHGYWNRSLEHGLVINMPDELYKGYQKKENEDILRWEDSPIYKMD